MRRSKAEPMLRFAALIRVSTEQQANTGESLRTQRAEIEATVKRLGGTVATWYGGQEHATPGWEKTEIKRLLTDAQKQGRPWDAVIVTNADRWSRDNRSSTAGLEVLKKHKVRFFVGSTEHDLFNPEARLYLGMSATIGEYQARIQAKKSLENRIKRAKRGIPVTGKLPYGRTFDKTKDGPDGWGIDDAKQRIVEDVARRYLAGESMEALAAELGVNHTSLHKTLTKRCGDTWEQHFDSDNLNIHETVETHIPRLLPDKTIRAILEKVEANKTYQHGQTKNHYLLGRVIFCEACGYAMFGQTNHQTARYYRHAHAKRVRPCHAVKGWVRADALEEAVIRHLFEMFGNPAAVEKAIEAAIPDLDAMRQIQERLGKLDETIGKLRAGRQKVLYLVERGLCTEQEAEQRLQESKDALTRYQEERERLTASLANVPTASEAKALAKEACSRFKRVTPAFVRLDAKRGLLNNDFSRMTWEDKRALVQRVFAGKTVDGERRGVYISWLDGPDDGGPKRYRFTIKGLIERRGIGPMSQEVLDGLVDLECVGAEHQDAVLTRCDRHSPAPDPRERRSRGPRLRPAA